MEAVAVLIGIVIGVLAWRYARKHPPKKMAPRWAGVLCGFGAAVILAGIFAPTSAPTEDVAAAANAPTDATSTPAEPSAEEAIKALAPDKIVKVQIDTLPTPKQVWITVYQKASWSEASSVRDFAVEAYSLLKQGRPLFPDGSDVTFVLRVPTVDRYGNNGQEKIIEMAFNGSDIARMNFDSGQFTPDALMNLASPSARNGLGARVLAKYCADNDYATDTRMFCRKAAMAD